VGGQPAGQHRRLVEAALAQARLARGTGNNIGSRQVFVEAMLQGWPSNVAIKWPNGHWLLCLKRLIRLSTGKP
jgi:hypothetical protein